MKGIKRCRSATGVGLALTTLGAVLFKQASFGLGIMGLGIAHIVLGLLDKKHPIVNK